MFEGLVEQLYKVGYDLVKENIPAYMTNGMMTISRYIKSKHPIDFNKKFIDGKPILGSHKLYEGMIAGIASGSATGLALTPFLGTDYALYSVGASLLTSAGDLIGSFIKRRFGKPEGSDFPLIDRTTWLTLFPFLYNYIYNSNNFPLLYILTISIGYGLHYLFNRFDLIRKYKQKKK
jgi:CDP-2,3-bis-(O-geranylgeranyl)-sn-glycerol synthase